jgi:protein TonB
MRGLGAALAISLAAHVTVASSFVIGWPGAAREDQPGVILAEIVYETSVASVLTEGHLQNAAAINDPPIVPIEMTRRPVESSIKSSEQQPVALGADHLQTALSIELPDTEPLIPAPSVPITSLGLQSSIEPVLASPPDEPRRTWVVPRHKPQLPSHLSGAANSDEEMNVPMPTAKQTATPAPERAANSQGAGGRRWGVGYETVVAALPPSTDFISIPSDISAPVYAAPALGNQSPKYPYAARRRGIEGKVVIEAVVDRAGTVATAEVAVSSGYRLLDRAALSAVKRWVFHPARRRGRAVGATIAIPITFALETEAAIAHE